MNSRPVVGDTILSRKCFITLITLIRKGIREVLGLHMIPDVRSSRMGEVMTKRTGVLASEEVPLNILIQIRRVIRIHS